jgi:hypothetical protein
VDLGIDDADLAIEPIRELDDLRVDRRARIADRLDVELPELAEPPGLGTVVAEHRPGQGQLHGLWQRLHPVLDVRPDDPGGRLRAERPGLAVLGPRREPEQLLLDDVGDRADAALEDRDLLEHRRLDRPVAVARGQVGPDPLEPDERGSLGRQDVARASWGAEGGHRPRSLAADVGARPTVRRRGAVRRSSDERQGPLGRRTLERGVRASDGAL